MTRKLVSYLDTYEYIYRYSCIYIHIQRYSNTCSLPRQRASHHLTRFRIYSNLRILNMYNLMKLTSWENVTEIFNIYRTYTTQKCVQSNFLWLLERIVPKMRRSHKKFHMRLTEKKPMNFLGFSYEFFFKLNNEI